MTRWAILGAHAALAGLSIAAVFWIRRNNALVARQVTDQATRIVEAAKPNLPLRAYDFTDPLLANYSVRH